MANARQVQLISASSRKNDRMDAQMLARLARVDPELLRPIRHRSEQAQVDLMVIRVRAALVEARTSAGECGARAGESDWESGCRAAMPTAWAWSGCRRCRQALQQALQPLLEAMESLTEKIQALDQQVEQIARTKYPETELLTASERSGDFDRSDVRADGGRSGTIPKEPGCGLLCGFAAEAERLGGEPAAAADHQGRRSAICGSCWCKERTALWGGADRIRI